MTRSAALRDLERQVANPEWLASLEDDSPPPRQRWHTYEEAVAAGEISPIRNPISRWYLQRSVRRAEQRLANDPDLQRHIAEGHRYRRAHQALVSSYGRLVGPDAPVDDPLLKTRVAYMMGLAHLVTTAGITPDVPRVL